MVEKKLTVDEAHEKIMTHIRKKENFLLSGGAGSGKTTSLVITLSKIVEEFPMQGVACITFTNNARREIENRVSHSSVRVSTIHDFLWDAIKPFQEDIKEALPSVINHPPYKIKLLDLEKCPNDYFQSFDKIQYKEILKLNEGIISHNEVLKLAHYMFNHKERLVNIIRDRYPIILIDEYQDTNPLVVEIMLKILSPKDCKDKNKPVIGFFGDSMQAIYDEGIGDLENYFFNKGGHLYEERILVNRRSPQSVINLANKLRMDGLQQEPSKDLNATNMNPDGTVKEGTVTFLHSDEPLSHDEIVSYIKSGFGWDFDNHKSIKELNLTHNLIANKGQFSKLMEIFTSDEIIVYVKKLKDFIDSEKIEDTEGLSLENIIDKLNKLPEKKKEKILKIHNTCLVNNKIWWEKAIKMQFDELCKYTLNQAFLTDCVVSSDEEKSDLGRTSPIIKHLIKIEKIIRLYKEDQYHSFLRLTGRRISSMEDRKKLNEEMDTIINKGDKTIGEIIQLADQKSLIKIDDKLAKYKKQYPYQYERVCDVPFKEFLNFYNYCLGNTPFSTQHRTKGSEFDNVLVILESGAWKKYNFGYLFGEGQNKKKNASYQNILNRTKKLFYVCCTRAKENLIVYYPQPSQKVIETAEEWFGKENVVKIPPKE